MADMAQICEKGKRFLMFYHNVCLSDFDCVNTRGSNVQERRNLSAETMKSAMINPALGM